jgi:hypothetical protein
MGIRSLFVACLCWSSIAAGQTSVAAKPYDVQEAYQIYSLLLPKEESYGLAKGRLVIQQDAVQKHEALSSCLADEAANKFRDAISDFDRLETKSWLLQRKFQIAKPYILVDSDTIGRVFRQLPGGWDSFYKRYPDSGGYLIISPVGFNNDKTQAIVYTGSSCGGVCGRWSFHLLEKVQGKWKEAPGVTCSLVS